MPCLTSAPCCAVGSAAVARRHEIDASPGAYFHVGAAVPVLVPVAALAMPLREYPGILCEILASQRLLLAMFRVGAHLSHRTCRVTETQSILSNWHLLMNSHFVLLFATPTSALTSLVLPSLRLPFQAFADLSSPGVVQGYTSDLCACLTSLT